MYNHIDLIFCEGFTNNLQLNLTSPWEMCIHAYIYPALGRWDFPPRNSSQETGHQRIPKKPVEIIDTLVFVERILQYSNP